MPRRNDSPKKQPKKKRQSSAVSTIAVERKVRENGYQHFTQEQTAKLFGIGREAMRTMAGKKGFPMIAKKINPDHLKRWLWEHHEELSEEKLASD